MLRHAGDAAFFANIGGNALERHDSAAPAFSAITACSALTTSMMTPPFSISANPTFNRNCSFKKFIALIPSSK